MEKVDNTPLIADISDVGVVNNYIPGGILKAKYDEHFTIVEANNGYFDLVGYTKDEIWDIYKNRGFATLHPEDAVRAAEQLLRQIAESDLREFKVNCRLVNKDAGYKYVQFCGRLVSDEAGEQYFYFQLIDIDDHMRTSKELEKERDFNLLIASFTDNAFFDYNLKKKCMRYSQNLAKKLGIPPVIENYPKPLIERGMVSEIDMAAHKSNYKKNKQAMFETEAKFTLKTGEVLWYLCHYRVLYSANDIPKRVVGKMMDITSQKTQITELTHRAITDQLTGVYNKMTIQSFIEEHLETATYTNESGALLIIDLDNFKQINDTFGHSFGDAVLTEAANEISHRFRKGDLVGRLGGDEFVVYMKGKNSVDGVISKANEICKALKKVYENNDVSIGISASVGVALFPDHGNKFAELYENADIALYTVKYSGKNRYKIYSGEERPLTNEKAAGAGNNS